MMATHRLVPTTTICVSVCSADLADARDAISRRDHTPAPSRSIAVPEPLVGRLVDGHRPDVVTGTPDTEADIGVVQGQIDAELRP